MSYLGIKDDVFDLLTKFPETRDSDDKLIAAVWSRELRQQNVNTLQITGMVLLRMISNGELTSPESITRCRRKTQEDHHELRGEKYRQRQEKQEEVKEELGYNE